jgi:holo-[acyl-carrier protein] synthase
MNVQAIGVDLCEIRRIADLVDHHGNRFIDKIFTSSEKSYCQKKRKAAESFAARFAAKEALLKALGTGLRGQFRWKDIEIINDDLGKPEFRFYGATGEQLKMKKVLLSLSHTETHAIAFVMVI